MKAQGHVRNRNKAGLRNRTNPGPPKAQKSEEAAPPARAGGDAACGATSAAPGDRGLSSRISSSFEAETIGFRLLLGRFQDFCALLCRTLVFAMIALYRIFIVCLTLVEFPLGERREPPPTHHDLSLPHIISSPLLSCAVCEHREPAHPPRIGQSIALAAAPEAADGPL